MTPLSLARMETRQLRLLLGGGLALLATALCMYLLWPQIKAYRGLAASRALLQTAGASQADLAAQLDGLRQEIARLQHGLHGDMGALPAEQMESFIIGKLQDISWRHQLELVSVKPVPGDKVHVFQSTLFDVEVAGDYFQFVAWLQDLHRELGFLAVEQYEMAPADRSQATPRLNVKLHIVAYRAEPT